MLLCTSHLAPPFRSIIILDRFLPFPWPIVECTRALDRFLDAIHRFRENCSRSALSPFIARHVYFWPRKLFEHSVLRRDTPFDPRVDCDFRRTKSSSLDLFCRDLFLFVAVPFLFFALRFAIAEPGIACFLLAWGR